MIEAIVFDFDGTLVDSNNIKRDTYFDIFSHINNSMKLIQEILKNNPKKTRYGIIENVLIELKEKNLVQYDNLRIEVEKYASKYSQIVESETIKADEIFGAKNSLIQLSSKYPLFIVTATLQKSIDKIIDAKNWRNYFKGIYGANGADFNKPELLDKIAKKYCFNPSNSIFIGDGQADYECALVFNMSFIAILNETNDFLIRKDINYKLNDLQGLPLLIEKINFDCKGKK